MPLWGYGLIGLGVICSIVGWACYYAGGKSDDIIEKARRYRCGKGCS